MHQWSSNFTTIVLEDIEREIVNGNCTEISLVGWSRRGLIAMEVAQELMRKKFASIYEKIVTKHGRSKYDRTRYKPVEQSLMLPEIKFLGLFDVVEMMPSTPNNRSVSGLADKNDSKWGEIIPKKVKHAVHLIAEDRTFFTSWPTALKPINRFLHIETKIDAQNYYVRTFPRALHSDAGGFSNTPNAKYIYNVMRQQATIAGVK